MKLQRFRLEQLRQFRQPLEISQLAPGLNLIVGPNESGKSTIVRALRAAFFERHRSTSVTDLQPWGDSSASPSVALEFDWGGERWALTKSFLRTKRCDLRIGRRNLSGDEAEQALADLLGFELASRGASKAEHWGVPGLLWIEQGASQDIREPVRHAGKHLQAVLASSLGEMASSEGDALIAAVEQARGELLTPTGSPRRGGPLQVASAEHARLSEEAAALSQRISQYREQVDRLAELQQALQRDESEQIWLHYRAQVQVARTKLNEIAGWEQQQRHDRGALEDVRQRIAGNQALLEDFARQSHERGQRQQALEQHARALETQQALAPAVEQALSRATERLAQARTQLQTVRQSEQRSNWQRELDQLEPDLNEAAQRLQRVSELEQAINAQRAELEGLQLAPALLTELRTLDQQLQRLELSQQTQATRLHFALTAGSTLQLDGEALDGEGERLLLAPATLELTDGSRLRIEPGGKDTGNLQRQLARLGDEQRSLLSALGVPSLAAAETRAAAAGAAAERLRGHQTALQALAPKGVTELQAQQQRRRARCDALRQQLTDSAVSTAADAQATQAALPTLAGAEAALTQAEDALQSAEHAAQQRRNEVLLAQQALSNATQELERLDAMLQAPDRQQREQAALVQLGELRARTAGLEHQLAQRDARISAAQPALLEQDIERLERSADAAENSARARRLELERLQASLSALDADGLEERAAELDAELERSARREAELSRRAQALELLRELLQRQRQALTRQLQAPLQRHLQHYLQLLFPGASLEVDEALVPQLLLRPAQPQGAEQSEVDGLSYGAREQMGLISRLAYADLLHEAGRPTLLMLDDALVHSDAERLHAMKRVLFDAAQRHQILLFSCHPQQWRDLGVEARELNALRAGPTANQADGANSQSQTSAT